MPTGGPRERSTRAWPRSRTSFALRHPCIHPLVDRFSRLGWWYSEGRATPGVAHLRGVAGRDPTSCQDGCGAGDNPTTEYSGKHGDTNMKDTFFDRLTGRALRVAFLGGLIGMQIVACSSSSSNAGDDTTAGTGGTDSAGSAGTAQAAGGDSGSTSTGTSGGQATAGSTGSGGATGKGGAGGSGNPIVDAGPRTGPLKIMALGDSTTEFTCYRAELAKLLDKSH